MLAGGKEFLKTKTWVRAADLDDKTCPLHDENDDEEIPRRSLMPGPAHAPPIHSFVKFASQDLAYFEFRGIEHCLSVDPKVRDKIMRWRGQ